MGKVVIEMSMSLDGFIAGPNDNLEQVHDWMYPAKGEVDPVNAKNIANMFASTGAVIMGWRTWDLGDRLNDWVANPPYKCPMIILVGELPLMAADAGPDLIFATSGIESALKQAKDLAGDKNVMVGGGANVAQQYLKAGLADELHLHIVPFLLGAGITLFENITRQPLKLEQLDAVEAPGVTHVTYRIGN